MNTGRSKHENIKAIESELQLSEEMDNLKVSEANAMVLLSDCNKRIRELEAELKKREENETQAENSQCSMNEKTLLEEIRSLKLELKLASEAEENSTKAMEDLALALKEVATEASQVKKKLSESEEELQQTKKEAVHLKGLLESTEEKCKELIDEADRYRNTAERLRLEAEETLAAWNGKETEFVNCVRIADEERLAAKREATRLLEKIRIAENRTLVAKEENQKLRDILKQALNEASVAKEAAGIAQAENSQLKDTLASREEALSLLAQENEMLKIHEAAAFENIKELKRMLSESSAKEWKREDKDKSSTPEQKDDMNLSKVFSLNLKEIIVPNKQGKEENEEGSEETNETLKGSIFDESTCTPNSVSDQHDGEILGGSIDFDHLDDEMGNSRRKKALLRRFSDLITIRRRANPRKESSVE